jgi:SAM-dependent methyltransferase
MISPREYSCATTQNEIYGEIKGPDFMELVKQCPCTISRVMDVGCGTGRALVYLATSSYGIDLEYLYGIECNLYRFNKCQQLLEAQSDEVLNRLEFVCDDFTRVSFSDTDLVYCCNTMFDETLNDVLVHKLIKEKVCVFALYTSEIKCAHLFWKCILVSTSWGKDIPVYLYWRARNAR